MRSFKVDAQGNITRYSKIVDCGEMKNSGRFGADGRDEVRPHPEIWFSDVAFNYAKVKTTPARLLSNLIDLLFSQFNQGGLHQKNEPVVILRQPTDQSSGNKTRKPCYE